MPLDVSIRILLIDDVPAIRSMVRSMLTSLGFRRVVEAEDGDQAWETLQESLVSKADRFDLVITDWSMPGLSGAELLRAIRSDPRSQNIPILIVTSHGDGEHLSEAQRAGVTQYLVKPFNTDLLKEQIQKALTKTD